MWQSHWGLAVREQTVQVLVDTFLPGDGDEVILSELSKRQKWDVAMETQSTGLEREGQRTFYRGGDFELGL